MIQKVKHKGLALAVLAAAQFMVILDATIVNVALPAIQKSLGFTNDAQLQWVVTAYALVFGGFLLLGGRLADLFGRRRIFLAGVAIFAATSLLAGVSQNPGQLIVFRALQGLGGALLSPAALSLVLIIFKEGKERNKALGVWGMVAAGGGAVGLLVGGLLTQYVNWRWNFFINVPVGLLVTVAALKLLPQSVPVARQKLDVLGAITVTASLISLVYGLVKAPENGWTDTATLGMFGLSVVLMIAFLITEMRARKPLVNLNIFYKRNVTGGVLLQLLMPASVFGMFFYLSIYMQQMLHFSPTKAGVANLPFTFAVMVVAGLLSQKAAKVNAKAVLVVSSLLVVAGLLYLSRMPVQSNYWTDLLPGIVLIAVGMAGVFVKGTMVATHGVSHQESGVVSGLLNTGQQIGGAIGLAVLSVVSTSTTTREMAAAHGNPAALPNALVQGFQSGFMAASLFAIAAGAVALVVIKTFKPTQTDLDRKLETEDEALSPIPGA